MGMYQPRIWPFLASDLASLLAGDGAPILNGFQTPLNLSDTSPQSTMNSAAMAVTCTDGPELYGKYTPDEAVEEVLEWALKTAKTTSLFAPMGIEFPCFHWKKRASERFTGPFNTTGLANPILVIGNTADVSS